MNWLRKLGRLLFNRVTLVLIGLLLLCLLIWFIGPLIAIAEWRPLESERVRVWLIAAILIVYLLKLLIVWWIRKGINGRLFSHMSKLAQPTSEKPAAPGEQEVAELGRRFQSAMTTLKKTGVQRTGTGSWLGGFGRQYIYELPWYMFIGAPGSGKTTALTNAGLSFPLAEQFGKSAVRGVGGTRNCDWWFTNEAVLLDTAGRYTTQQSNTEIDKSEWTGFLSLLKKYRPRQPLNGALLTVSTTDLLCMSEAQRVEHAAALRKRLYELRDMLGIQFPVYVLVTKVDLLSGFGEYFYELDRQDRAQVLGFTFPYDETKVGVQSLTGDVQAEFDLLSRRLYDGLNTVLLRESDLSRRALAYAFPQQFAGLRDVLTRFIADVFVESKYGEQPLVRGVYFTSGTQEGSTLDRVLGGLSRAFRMEGRVQSSLANAAQGKSYFLQDLLQKVIFAEAHLAGRNLKWERRLRLLRTIGLVGCVTALTLAVGAWVWSYRNNTDYVGEVSTRAADASQNIQAIGKTPDTPLPALLQVLDQVRGVSSSSQFAVAEPPIGYTYGLYQGAKMDAATTVAYQRILDDGLLPIVAKRVEAWLLQPPQANNLELQYETLKAYLMLHEAEHYDAEFLKTFASLQLGFDLPEDATKEQRDQLNLHLSSLFDGRVVSSPYPKDSGLIKQTRDRLSHFSLGQLSYARLKRRLEHNELGDFSIPKAGGPQASLIFRFKSKKPLTSGVPGLFSYRGYHELFKKEVESVATKFGAEEAWVLDPGAASARSRLEDISRDSLVNEIKRLYLNEYADTWDAFLKDVELIPTADLQQSIQIARTLSAPDSPMSLFIKAASKETTLLREDRPDNQSVLGRTIERAKSGKNDIERLIGTNALPTQAQPREKLELIVDNRFEALRRLAQSPGGQGPAPIDAVVVPLVNELYTALVANDTALRSGSQPPQSDVGNKMRAEAARLPSPLRELLTGLASAGAAQTATVARAAIAATMDSSVGQFCRRAVAGRYPLARGSAQEITPSDFAQLFASGGLMDDFYQKNLASIVDISTNPWSYKRGPDGGSAGGAGNLGPFQRAQTIRDVFFRGGGRMPSVSFAIKPVEMDATITQVTFDVDGQVLKYSHGPQLSQNMTWPGPRGSNQVRYQLTPQQPGNSGLLTEGAWALHRFFDKVETTPGSSSERFFATVTIDGRKAKFEIVASSVQNPFALRALQEFSCP